MYWSHCFVKLDQGYKEVVATQGDVLMTKQTEPESDKKQPAMKDEKKILSTRMLAFLKPTREQISVVSTGV